MPVKQISLFKKFLIAFIVLIAIAGGIWIYDKYSAIYHPNITVKGTGKIYFYVPTGATFTDVVNRLYENGYVVDRTRFEWVAEQKNLRNNIKPGRYLLKEAMTNNELVNLLRAGLQEPVSIIINNIRTKSELASRISAKLEANSDELIKLLSNNKYLSNYNFNSETAMVMFLPNTYEFYWNTSADDFIKRMHNEYARFWTKKKKEKAARTELTIAQVSIMASIVDMETQMKDEKPVIAGVYINRLRRGMRLEADPTVIFATGDFTITRVLYEHKDIDSPYNTYKYYGLPPGPISMPSVSTIEAVLDYQKHDFLYFCAKEDFSGFHNFASTFKEHIINANKFRKELDRRNILK